MVAGFRRSLSLSGLSPSASPARCRRRDAPHHARSVSLPCRSHPALSLIQDEIHSLRSSVDLASPSSASNAAASVLDRIDHLLAAVEDLLRLPQMRDPLRRRSALADRLLDASLRLADAQGCFRSAALALSQHAAESRAAARRRDSSRLASAARSHRQAEKELAGLASAIKDLTRCPPFTPGIWANAAEAEIGGIVAEAMAAIATAISAVFLRMASVASAAAASVSKDSWRVWAPRKREGEEEAMARLEENMEGLEEGSERVYRSLVNIRVSLLNIITPSL